MNLRLKCFARRVVLSACAAMVGCSTLTHTSTDADGEAPLGSFQNPVLCNSVRGERDYLARLRCGDGTAPAFARLGSLGKGPDGHTFDRYLVQCEGEEAVPVMMDLFHTGYREMAPIPGFDIVAELPAAGQTVCPPEVPYEEYAFVDVELAKPARILDSGAEPAPENSVMVAIEFVVGTNGVAEVDTARVLDAGDERVEELLAANLLRFHFSPAEHHPGCRVRQRVNGVFVLDRNLSPAP